MSKFGNIPADPMPLPLEDLLRNHRHCSPNEPIHFIIATVDDYCNFLNEFGSILGASISPSRPVIDYLKSRESGREQYDLDLHFLVPATRKVPHLSSYRYTNPKVNSYYYNSTAAVNPGDLVTMELNNHCHAGYLIDITDVEYIIEDLYTGENLFISTLDRPIIKRKGV